jgi:CheY-like chemotaxis protein
LAAVIGNDRVLVVDDDQATREELSRALAAEGFQVSAVGNGAEALEVMARDGGPNVILLDLEMPVMSGWEFHSLVRRDPGLSKTPIIVISGHVQNQIVANAHGVEFVLRKPVALDDLLAYVGRYARRAS